MQATIPIYRNSGKVVLTAPVTKECKRSYELMQKDEVTLKFSVGYSDVVQMIIGDYIEIDGERFVLNENTAPAYNRTTGGYDYTLVFVAKYMTWGNILMKSAKLTESGAITAGETEWNLTAPLMEHACAIVYCVNMFEGRYISPEALRQLVKIDTSYVTQHAQYKHATYNSTNVLQALDGLCKEDMYDCEWWVEKLGSMYELHFGRRAYTSAPVVTITQGENGVITREPSRNEYANRIYVYGGTQNVPYSYRKDVWLTNELKDGKLWDSHRAISPEMIDCEKTRRAFDYPAINVTKTPYDYKEAFDITAAYSFKAPTGDVSRGRYKIRPSQIVGRASLSLKGKLNFEFYPLEAEIVITGYGRQYKGDVSRTEYLSNEGLITGYVFSANFDKEEEDEFIYLGDASERTFNVKFRVRFGHKTNGNPIAEMKDFIKYTDFKVEVYEIGDLPFIERLDYEDVQIKAYDESGKEYDAMIHWDVYDGAIYSHDVDFAAGRKYRISPLVYTAIGENYYTPDNGEDVINGLTEMRLRLPASAPTTTEGYRVRNGYIEYLTGGVSIVEKAITHDDIFPSVIDMPVTAVDDTETREASVTYSDGTKTRKEYRVYKVFARMSNGLPVDAGREEYDFKQSYLLKDVSERLKVKFLTGQLAGMEFEAIFNESEQSYIVVPNSDYGMQFPNESLRPKEGDQIMLIGWDTKCLPELGMIATAEARLLEAARKDLREAIEGSYTYKAEMLPDTSDLLELLVDANGQLLTDSTGEGLTSTDIVGEPMYDVGSCVTLRDRALFAAGSSTPLRIIGYERQLDLPWDKPRYTIGEIPKPSRTERIKSIEHELKNRIPRK